VGAIPKLPLEAVPVEKRHEELEILFFAIVGGSREKQEVPRQRGKKLAQVVALGVLDLPAEVGGRHLVGFVAHDKIPPTVRGRELRLDILVSAEFVQPGNDQVVL